MSEDICKNCGKKYTGSTHVCYGNPDNEDDQEFNRRMKPFDDWYLGKKKGKKKEDD